MSQPPTPDAAASAKEVVVAMFDGRQLRGLAPVFNPQKNVFHVHVPPVSATASSDDFYMHAPHASSKASIHEVRFDQVKMVCFFRTANAPRTPHPPTTRVVTVRLTDDHILRGITEAYGGARTGMYVIPIPEGPFERVYIPISAVRDVLAIEKLGDILIAQGAVSPQMVDQAVRRQAEVRAEPLGDILVRQHVITEEQLRSGLTLQAQYQGTKKIGQILLEQGFIDQSQIDEALEVQKTQRRKKVGEILVDMGFATYKMIAIALAMQCGSPFLDLQAQSFHPQLAALLPAVIARRWQVIPVTVQQQTLTLAVSDPIDHPGLNEIRRLTGMSLAIVIATPQDITRAITTLYGKPSP